MGKSITRYLLTDHVKEEMVRRNIEESEIGNVLANPDQMEEVIEGRNVYQSKITKGEPPKTRLLRVFVDIDRDPPEVVTVYRTSKVEKYWRTEK